MTINLPCKDINEANAVLAVLGKLPYEQVADLIGRFRSSIEEQLNPPAPPAPPAEASALRSNVSEPTGSAGAPADLDWGPR